MERFRDFLTFMLTIGEAFSIDDFVTPDLVRTLPDTFLARISNKANLEESHVNCKKLRKIVIIRYKKWMKKGLSCPKVGGGSLSWPKMNLF